MLYIIYSRLDSDRYPFYDSKEEYFRAFVDRKRSSKELGLSVGSRLIEENAALRKRIEQVEHFSQEYDKHRAIMKVLEKYNIWAWRSSDVAELLDKRLSQSCPEDISSVRRTLEGCVERIKRMEKSNETTNL